MANPNLILTPKGYYDHFTPEEMEMFAAYIRSFQVLPRYQSEYATELNRPYSPFDRFILAVRFFQELFDQHPDDGLSFVIAWYDKGRSLIESGAQRLDPRQSVKSKEIWDAIISNDEEKLDSYVDGFGGKACENFGLKRLDAKDVAPMQRERRTLNSVSLDELRKTFQKKDNKDEPKEEIDLDPPTGEPQAEKKKPGRPRKDAS